MTVRPGTDKLLAKAERLARGAETALAEGAPDLAAGRAFSAMLNAAKARLNESGVSLRTHARIARAYETLPEVDSAPAVWLRDALALRGTLAKEGDGLEFAEAEALVARARHFVNAVMLRPTR